MLEINFTPFPKIETERLVLREITKADVAELFVLRSSKTVMQYIGREPAKSFEEVEAFIAVIAQAQKNNESILWGMCLREDPSKIIGTICFWQLQPENYKAEIGYILDPEYWGRGIITETIDRVLQYGFSVLKLHKVEAHTSPENIPSCKVLEKNGFVKEGHLEDNFFFDGKFYDTIIYSRINR